MSITPESIDLVRQSANIETVVGRFVKLDKHGFGSCPFHDEKSASFKVNIKNNYYKCFGCGKAGDAIGFVMDHKNLTFIEAVEYLAGDLGITIEHTHKDENPATKDERTKILTLNKAAARQYLEAFWQTEWSTAQTEVFENRQLDPETVIKFQLGFAPNEWKFITERAIKTDYYDAGVKSGLLKTKDGNTYDAFRNRIMIPIHDVAGHIVGFGGRYLSGDKEAPKYLNSAESSVYKKDRVLYGLHHATKAIKDAGFAVLVEGYFDVISLFQADICNAVASCGTAFTKGHAKLLKRYTGHVVMCFDGDKAGQAAAAKALPVLLAEGFRVDMIQLPEGHDPDSHIRTSGKNYLGKPADALLTLTEGLISKASGPDERQEALNAVCQWLASIEAEMKREEYVQAIAKAYKIKATIISKQVKELLAEADDDQEIKTELKNALPDGVDIDDYKQFGFYEDKRTNSYWSVGTYGKLYEVSNFTLRILYHVKTNSGAAYRLVEIKNKFGFSSVINLNTDDFVTVGSFKKIVAREGNFIFKGGDVDLVRLQDKLQRVERPTEFVDCLGWNRRGFYSFGNGLYDCNANQFFAVDDYGIVDFQGVNYFIPAMSRMFKDREDLFVNDRKFVFIPSNVDYRQWVDLFCKVYGDKAKIGLMFYFAALFRDIVYQVLNRRFPLLFLYGLRGSGKGTFAQSIMKLFGEGQDQYMLSGAGTVKGFMRKFAQYQNAIVWLDEYKNNQRKEYIEAEKNIYDGVGYERAKMDNTFQTETIPIRSACLMSGQEMPTIEPALFTRVIQLTFSETKGYTEKQRMEFKTLQEMEADGLSHFTVKLLKHRKAFEERYKEVFEDTFKEWIKTVNRGDIDERLILNVAALGATCRVLLEAGEYLPFTYEQFKAYALANMTEQHSHLVGSDDLSKFWAVVETLFVQGKIKEGTDFELSDGFLYLRVQNVQGLYETEMVARREINKLAKATLENYLVNDAERFVARKKKQFSDGSYTWCMQFHYAKLDINLIRGEGSALKLAEMGVDVNQTDQVAPASVPSAEIDQEATDWITLALNDPNIKAPF